jgi:hypothetical protein
MSRRHALHTDQTSSFGGDMPVILVEAVLVDALQHRHADRDSRDVRGCARRRLQVRLPAASGATLTFRLARGAPELAAARALSTRSVSETRATACRECAWRALEIHQLTRRAVSQTAAKGGFSSLEPRLH